MKKVLLVSLVLILFTLTAACSKTPTATGTANTANTLFFDDFTKTDSGWTQVQNTIGTAGYVGGEFRINVVPQDTQIISNPGKSFAGDVIVEVDARKTGGPQVSYLGVLCHYQNPENYYMFLITTDGFSGIIMNKAGVLSMISPGAKFLKMDGINTGGTPNHLRATCIGDALTLYANGKQVSLSYDKSITGGDVGLVVRSGRYLGGADITFDNYRVTKP